jgi:hypothetical protein
MAASVWLRRLSRGAKKTHHSEGEVALIHDGKIVFAKDNFLNVDFKKDQAITRMHFSGDLDLGHSPQGDYIISLVARDHSSTQIAGTRMAFIID